MWVPAPAKAPRSQPIIRSTAPEAEFTRPEHTPPGALHTDALRSRLAGGGCVGERCAVDDADREDKDAPQRKRRALALLLLLLAAGGIGIALLTREPPPAPPPVPAPLPPPPPPAPPPAPLPPPPPEPPKTPRAPKTKATPVEKPAPPSSTHSIVIGAASGGDDGVRKALSRSFARGLDRLDVRGRSDSGYLVSVFVDDAKHTKTGEGDDVTVRCRLSIAQLPKKNVLASLKARADASGEGTDVDELLGDAADACGATLAKDLSAWVGRQK